MSWELGIPLLLYFWTVGSRNHQNRVQFFYNKDQHKTHDERGLLHHVSGFATTVPDKMLMNLNTIRVVLDSGWSLGLV